MPARVPVAIVISVLFVLLTTGVKECADPAFNPSDVKKLESAEKSLEVCEKQLARVLDGLLEPRRRGRRGDHAVVNKLESIAHKFEVVERRVEAVVGPRLVQRRLRLPAVAARAGFADVTPRGPGRT